jgi:hypothetical protein
VNTKIEVSKSARFKNCRGSEWNVNGKDNARMKIIDKRGGVSDVVIRSSEEGCVQKAIGLTAETQSDRFWKSKIAA